MNYHSREHLSERVKPVFIRGNDAEVAPAAAQRPEEVFVLISAGPQQTAISGYDISREQIVAGKAVLAL
jgi:hypothetical protein